MARSPMYCPNCGTVAPPKNHTKGSFIVEVFLWLCFLVPGLIYSLWRITSKQLVCPECLTPGVIPETSPKAREALAARR